MQETTNHTELSRNAPKQQNIPKKGLKFIFLKPTSYLQ